MRVLFSGVEANREMMPSSMTESPFLERKPKHENGHFWHLPYAIGPAMRSCFRPIRLQCFVSRV